MKVEQEEKVLIKILTCEIPGFCINLQLGRDDS